MEVESKHTPEQLAEIWVFEHVHDAFGLSVQDGYELRNKVIEEMNNELSKIAGIPDWLLQRITRYFNSLKTK